MQHITMKIPREGIKWTESDGQIKTRSRKTKNFKEFREIVRILPRFLTTQKECREGG